MVVLRGEDLGDVEVAENPVFRGLDRRFVGAFEFYLLFVEQTGPAVFEALDAEACFLWVQLRQTRATFSLRYPR